MLTKTVSLWLKRIGHPESWLHPRLSEMSDWTLILERDLLIKRICQEIRSGGLVAVCSDYDVDGISSGSIITDCIRQCGGRAQILVSSRFGGGGYGLSDVMVDRVLSLGHVSLAVTCDFGGSDHARIQRLKDAGIDTCVIDHHITPSTPLPSYAFLNPNRLECPSKFKALCSGGLALSVASGILRELNIPKSSIDPMQWVDLAGCATIADVVDLRSDNRVITRKALGLISTKPRPGIQALLELSNVKQGTVLSARDISFKIAPALNSPGRLGPPDIIVDLLLSKDISEARRIASEVKQIWDKRREITDQITAECFKQVEEGGYSNDSGLALYDESWGHGIVGIVAARVVDRYGKPCAVMGSEGRGSLRGPPGSKLHSALVHCSDTLIRFGGHQAAAGLHIDPNRLNNFRQKFCDFFSQNPPKLEQDSQAVNPVLELNLEDDLLTLVEQLFLLEPTGQSNIKPLIQTHGLVKQWKQVKGNHEKFDVLLPNNVLLPCFKINTTGEALPSLLNKQVTVQGDLRTNTWNGKTKVEMFVSNVIF